MKILFDSNVIIDAITDRENFALSAKELFIKVANGNIDGYLVSKQITDIHYVLRKYITNSNTRMEFINFLINAFTILPFDKDDLLQAIALNGKDFEDDVLIGLAKNFRLDCIVTNNAKDFNSNLIKIYTPDELYKIL